MRVRFDLRSSWNLKGLSSDSGASEEALQRGFTDAWCYREVLPSEPTFYIRGCPECFAAGFHTAIYQFEFVKRCPVHGIALSSRCSNCGLQRPLTIQSLSSDGFFCECQHRPFRQAMAGTKRADLSEEMDRHLQDYRKWLTATKRVVLLTGEDSHRPECEAPRLFSTGSTLCRIETICAVQGQLIQSPEICADGRRLVSFEMSSRESGPSTIALELNGNPEGRGLPNKQFNFCVDPSVSQHEFLDRDDPVQLAEDLVTLFATNIMQHMLLQAETDHRPCFETYEHQHPMGGDSLCRVVAATTMLRSKWLTPTAIRKAVRRQRQQLLRLMAGEGAAHVYHAIFMSAELICQAILRDIQAAVRCILTPGWSRHLPKCERIADAKDPCFGMAILRPPKDGSGRVIWHCGITSYQDWREQWDEVCSGPHINGADLFLSMLVGGSGKIMLDEGESMP